MPSYADPFREIEKMSLEDALKAQELGLAELEAEPTRPHVGMSCTTSGGSNYLWGPAFLERTNQWQDFILRTRKKISGTVIHYGPLNVTIPRAWTHWTDAYSVAFPLDDLAANWILRQFAEAKEDHAIILSGMLLADLLDWVERNDADLKHDVVFTTFEPFPRHKTDMLFRHFDDWCDYSRSWDGGLSYYRCKHGRYHTFDHITVLKSSVDDMTTCHVTDLLNKAQRFVDHPSCDIVRAVPLEEAKVCECGLWHRDFELVGNSLWRFDRTDGTKTDANLIGVQDVCNEYQLVQREPGTVIAMRHGGWGGVETPSLIERIRRAGLEVVLQAGSYRRRSKRPFIFSELLRRGKRGFTKDEGASESVSFPSLS